MLASAGDKLVFVVEARAQGEETASTMLRDLAKAVGAIGGGDASKAVAERYPSVAGGPAKTEPVIEADELVQRGRDAYLDGQFNDATRDLTRARDVLSHAIESMEVER